MLNFTFEFFHNMKAFKADHPAWLALSLLVFSPLLFCTACLSPVDNSVGIGPFFSYLPEAKEVSRKAEASGPKLGTESLEESQIAGELNEQKTVESDAVSRVDKSSSWYIHPFYFHSKKKLDTEKKPYDQDSSAVNLGQDSALEYESQQGAIWIPGVPFAIFGQRVQKGRNRHWLAPLYYHSEYKKKNGVDWDSWLLPFFFGNDPDEGGYFAAFPLGGTWKGPFAQDRLDFFMFPAYMRLKDKERKSHHVLFPFVNWISAPQRSGGRFWPFYGHYQGQTNDGSKQKYDRKFALWPFYHSQANNLDTARPTKSKWIFPFYGTVENSAYKRTSILFPFYHHIKKKKDKQVTHASFLLGWNITRSDVEKRTDFWPFYGSKKREGLNRSYALWPFIRHEEHKKGSRRTEQFDLSPFYSESIREDFLSGERQSYRRLWPLYSVKKSKDGATLFTTLELLPYRGPEHFNKLYGRLWQLFRWVDRGFGRGTAWDALWGVMRRESTPARSYFSLLGGLYEHDRQLDSSRYKILYIPF